MKENLKVLNIDGATEWREVKSLFFSLGFSSVISGLTFMFTDKPGLPCRDINLPELREIARPKEYLNDKFELVVTNQPKDGWRLVPDGAQYFTEYPKFVSHLFWKTENDISYCYPISGNDWVRGDMNMDEYIEYWYGTKILWQRTPQQETIMKEEKKGRFLHQWAYEAFGRGEDVQYAVDGRHDFVSVSSNTMMSAFEDKLVKFRLKPQTIQIGSRTITKPISVKPELATQIFISNLDRSSKFSGFTWQDTQDDFRLLELNICHLTKEDAIAHCDALLELMK